MPLECGRGNAECEMKASQLRWPLHSAFRSPNRAFELDFGLGFPQASDAVAHFPLAALFEDFNPFKAFHDVALRARSAGGAQAGVL